MHYCNLQKSSALLFIKVYFLTNVLQRLKSPEHGFGINMGDNLNYPYKSKVMKFSYIYAINFSSNAKLNNFVSVFESK